MFLKSRLRNIFLNLSALESRGNNSSFTLVELLVVVGILAILVTAVIIVINPVEYLKQSRDSRRITELTSLSKSIQILESQNPSMSFGTASVIYISVPDSSSSCANLSLPSLPSGYSYRCSSTSTYTKTDGTGWIPINFDSSVVAQLSSLPIDPTNATSSGLYYTYTPGGSFKVSASIESTKYKSRANSDGGVDPISFESGSDLSLPSTLGPILYLKFEGNASDSSGFGHNGTWAGSSSSRYSSGIIGSYAGVFNGSDDNITIDNKSDLNTFTQFTVSLWVNFSSLSFTSPNDWYSFFGKHGYGSWPSVMMNNGKTVRFYTPDLTPSSLDYDWSSATVSNWNMLTFRYDGSKADIFFNGSSVASQNVSGTPSVNTNDFKIGSSGSNYYISALMDDFRIYNRALTDQEIGILLNAK